MYTLLFFIYLINSVLVYWSVFWRYHKKRKSPFDRMGFCHFRTQVEQNKVSLINDSNGNVLTDKDHHIDCKVDGFGSLALKLKFV